VILVCIECPGKKACTLFFPDEERAGIKPEFCGPDEEGLMIKCHWIEVPEIEQEKLICVN